MDSKPIYKQLLEAMRLMAKNDFKKGCDIKFLNQVSSLLNSEHDFNQFLLGVKVVKKLVGCYEYYS